MKSRPISLALTLACILLSYGCASVLSGDEQGILIAVTCKNRVIETYCTAENSKGKWFFNAPEYKMIKRDSAPLTVTCSSGSIGDYAYKVNSSLNLAAAGNVVSGGLIGAAVDLNTSSIWNYPAEIKIESNFCRIFK